MVLLPISSFLIRNKKFHHQIIGVVLTGNVICLLVDPWVSFSNINTPSVLTKKVDFLGQALRI
jgi:hypothetical protein